MQLFRSSAASYADGRPPQREFDPCLPPANRLSQNGQHPPRTGRYQPNTLPCSRFQQTFGPPLSGGSTRLRCRHTSVQTTTSGCAFTSTSAPNTAIPRPCPRAGRSGWLRVEPSPPGLRRAKGLRVESYRTSSDLRRPLNIRLYFSAAP